MLRRPPSNVRRLRKSVTVPDRKPSRRRKGWRLWGRQKAQSECNLSYKMHCGAGGTTVDDAAVQPKTSISRNRNPLMQQVISCYFSTVERNLKTLYYL